MNKSAIRWLVLIKHAMPVFDSDTPARDWPLSQSGAEAAGRLAQIMAADPQLHPSVLFCSPEPKAHDTARILGKALKLSVNVHADLHEHLRPAPIQEKSDFQSSVAAFFAQPGKVVYGEESADQAFKRFNRAVDAICNNETGNVCVVAHGTVISLLAARRCGLDGFELWQRLGLPSLVVVQLPEFRIGRIIEEIG